MLTVGWRPSPGGPGDANRDGGVMPVTVPRERSARAHAVRTRAHRRYLGRTNASHRSAIPNPLAFNVSAPMIRQRSAICFRTEDFSPEISGDVIGKSSRPTTGVTDL